MGLSLNLLPYVFIGGGIGATLRWVLSQPIGQLASRMWVGTLFVNLLGCLIYFLVIKYDIFEGRLLAVGLKAGILGSLTTFSTFSVEMVELIQEGKWQEALLVLLLNVVTGVLIGIGILR